MAIQVSLEPDMSGFGDAVRNQLVESLLQMALDLAVDDPTLTYRIEHAIEALP